jgi:UDP:flavonoid glycosyltransferase YjiC (YdhE family)
MARERIAALLPLCARRPPDVIVRDEADMGALIVAERLGVPYATVLNNAGGGLLRASRPVAALDALRAEHGLAPDPELEALDRHLVLSPYPPSLRDPADPLPATAHGYRAAEAPGAVPPVIAALPDGRPVVYVTLGTIFNTESGDLFARVLAGVRELPVEVVVTVGRSMDPAEVGPQPANVHVERYVPQAAVLPRCAAVVAHAGSGIVLGALEHGLPLVCLPMGADQPLNAARCTALGVGPTLDPLAATAEDVWAATAAVLEDPAHRAAAARLQAEIAALPPPEAAVERLERLAGRGGA